MTNVIWLFCMVGSVGGLDKLTLGYMGVRYRAPYGPPMSMQSMGSALLIALDFINGNDTILPNTSLEYVIQDSGCNGKRALGGLVELYRDKHADAVIGPACSGAAEPMGLLASEWNIPVISYLATSTDLSDKKTYDTFSRTSAPASQIGDVVRGVVTQFNWTRVAIMEPDIFAHTQKLTEGQRMFSLQRL